MAQEAQARSRVTIMERIVFGDNQFFGVNHMSEEKARAQSIRFRNADAIIELLDSAYAAGIKTFMCTTHERMVEICNYFRTNAASYPDYKFYPCMPYAHKYANAVTENGLLGALRSYLPESGALAAAVQGAKALVTADAGAITRLLIDAEMKMFAGLSTPVIFLQNVVTDLLLGLRFKDSFRVFSDHVRDRYGAEPGFITMNVPMLMDVLEEVGIENPIVCANINKAGFRMSGGINLYEKTLRERKIRLMAMSVFASGAISPVEALDYVCGLKKIQSIVFGASSRQHIEHTRDLILRMSAQN
jgi:hypothetical protein